MASLQPAGGAPAPLRRRGAPPWTRVTAYWLSAYRRTWRASVFSSFLSPLLFLAGMGFGLGSLVDAGGRTVGGLPYVQFVAPGVLAAQAFQVGVGEATFPVMGAIAWNRAYHAMLATPLRTRDVVVGHLAYALFRVATTTAIFTVVAVALGAVRSPGVVLAALVAVLAGIACSAPVYAVAARSETEVPFQLVFRFAVTPLFLFSGTFFPIGQLPHVLQWVAWATPLWHAVAASRDLAAPPVSGVPWAAVAGHVAYLAVLLVVGLLLALRSLRARMVV